MRNVAVPVAVLVAFVGIDNCMLQFDWRPAGQEPQTIHEAFGKPTDCVSYAGDLANRLIHGRSSDYRYTYEWHCTPLTGL